MSNKHLAVASVALIGFAFCTRSRNSRTLSPSDVVKTFYSACNEGRYADAEALITPESLKVLKSTFGLSGGVKGYCDGATENGTLQSVEIVSQQLLGDASDIHLILHRKSGNDQDIHESLIRSREVWKIQVGG
jgi:hypothetical protein